MNRSPFRQLLLFAGSGRSVPFFTLRQSRNEADLLAELPRCTPVAAATPALVASAAMHSTMHLPSRFLIVHSSRSHGSPQLRAFRPPSLPSGRVARAEGTDPHALRCASNEGSAVGVKRYGRGPRLSTRSTGAPCAST